MARRRLVAGAILAFGLVMSVSPAVGQTYTGVAPPSAGQILGPSVTGATTGGAAPAGQVLPSQVSAPQAVSGVASAQSSRLALTGADVVSLVMLAIPLIAVGTFMIRRGRLQPTGRG